MESERKEGKVFLLPARFVIVKLEKAIMRKTPMLVWTEREGGRRKKIGTKEGRCLYLRRLSFNITNARLSVLY